MFGKIHRYLYGETRPELHNALTVLVFSSALGSAYLGLCFLLPFVGLELDINFEFSGYLIGCIGSGELARGLAKLHFPKISDYLFTSIAGAVTIGLFWICMALKWQHDFWTIPLALVIGALFYLLLVLAQRFDNWFYNRF